MSLRILLSSCVVFLSTVATVRGSSLEETLLSKEKEFIEAIQQQDQTKMKQMFAPQAFTVVPGAGRQTGDQILKRLAGTMIDRYQISDVHVIEVSQDVGILSFKYTWSGRAGGKQFQDAVAFATSTWAKQDGEWKVVVFQETAWHE